MFIWVTSSFEGTLLEMIEAHHVHDVGSTLCSDMTFQKVRDANLVTVSHFDYILKREIPLIVGITPKRKDTALYFTFWSHILKAVPFLLNRRDSDNQWVFSLPGLTVDFDQAQLVGFATAIGYQILPTTGNIPPPTSAPEAQLTDSRSNGQH